MAYNKYTWTDGEYIYPSQLNHIEQGINELDDTYTPYQWKSGDMLSSVRFNHIEDGVYGLHDDYEKTAWQRNDIITAERLNHIEDNIYKITDHTITAVATNGTIPETTGWVIVGDVATKIVAEGEPYGDLPVPTRSGYNFTGWYTASTGGTQVTSETIMGDSDVAIYAQWVQESYGTVLYTDGTFIINEPASQRAANIVAHGAVTNEYAAFDGSTNDYVFSGTSDVPWYNERTSITNVIIGSVIQPTSTAYWFSGGSNILGYDFGKLDTSNVTSMAYMFSNNSNVIRIDISSFATPNVLDTQYMFQGCSKLASIIATESFESAQITSSTYMFQSCSTLLGGAGTTYSSSYRDKSRAKIDKGSNDSGYFTLGGNKLTVLYTDGTFIINELKAQHAANIAAHGAVKNYYNCFDINVFPYDFEGVSQPWANQRSSIVSTVIGSAVAPTKTAGWFNGFENCTSFDLGNLDTSDVTDMEKMFTVCSSVTSLNLSNFDTSKVTDMSSMFSGCHALGSLNVSSFDTSEVTDMGGMFKECDALTSLNLANFNTSSVTYTANMFWNCTNLVTIYVSNLFVVTQVTNSGDMFRNCTSLVGGAGTAFSSSYRDKSRAKIDGGVGDEGYFTAAS